MKKLFVLISIIQLYSCMYKVKSGSCLSIDAGAIDTEKTLILRNAIAKQTQTGIHDTTAIDLFVTIKDHNGNPIEEVMTEIRDIRTKSSNKEGKVEFIAFNNDGGTFSIKCSHRDHGCIEIYNLNFVSGYMRWLEVTMP